MQLFAMDVYMGLVLGVLTLSVLIPSANSRTLSCVGPVYREGDASFSISCAAEYYFGYDLAFTSCIIRHRHEYCRLVRVWEGSTSSE